MDKFWFYTIALGLFFLISGGIIFFVTKNQASNEKKKHWLKYVVTLSLVFPLIFIFMQQSYTLYAIGVIALLGLYEIQHVLAEKKGFARFAISFFFLIILIPIFFNPLILETATPLYFFVVIFEGLSEALGQVLNGPKLWSSLGLKQTWLGTLGALLILSILGYFVYGHLYGITSVLFIAVLAFIGKLLAAAIKRKAGTHSFSQLAPGHGGILEIFDGFLFSLAAFTWIQMGIMFTSYPTI